MSKTTSDVITLISQIAPRATDIPTSTFLGILNNILVPDLEEDMVSAYPDDLKGFQDITVSTPYYTDLPADYGYPIRVEDEDGNVVPVAKKQDEISANEDYVWFDNSTDPPRAYLSDENNWGSDLLLTYRKKITEMGDGDTLTFPEALHGKLLPILAFGAAYYYLAMKPGSGDNDMVAKLQEMYQTSRANLFSGGGVRGGSNGKL